jgi:hypothetical protein
VAQSLETADYFFTLETIKVIHGIEMTSTKEYIKQHSTRQNIVRRSNIGNCEAYLRHEPVQIGVRRPLDVQ